MTFLDKYELLKKSVPIPAVFNMQGTENCELTDYTFRSKNCYYCFDGYESENATYCVTSVGKNLVDCYYAIECELCYECIGCNKCYNSSYLVDCNNCRDCHFCSFCISCVDCFGCVGLTHKQYCIFNKQYAKEEYEQKVKELKKQNPEKILEHALELKKTIPHPASQQENNENCPYGDYIYDSKNCYWCFDAYWMEDCGYNYESGLARRVWDTLLVGGGEMKTLATNTELIYESICTEDAYNSAYLVNCVGATNCYYSSYLMGCSDCFGCVGLSNKKYCILNNQLTKEKYEEALVNIKKELGWRV